MSVFRAAPLSFVLVLLRSATLLASTPAPPPATVAAVSHPSEPPAASYEFALAKLLGFEGAVDDAEAAFDRALALSAQGPDTAYLFLEKAQLLARAAEYAPDPARKADLLARAVASLAEAQRLAADNLDVLRAVASIELDLATGGDKTAVAKAQEALERVQKSDPADAQTAITLGRIYLEQDQPGRAADVLRRLVDKAPQQRMAYALLVEALVRAERTADAETALAEILAADPAALEAVLTLANLQSKRGDHQAELHTLRAAPADLQGDRRLQRQLAWALFQTGDLDQALASVEALIVREPQEPSHQLLRGLILSADGRREEALAGVLKVAQTQPKNVMLQRSITGLLERLGRRPEAAERLLALSAALAQPGPTDDSQALRNEAARLYAAEKDWQRVSSTVTPLLAEAASPARVEARLLAADALQEQGKTDLALAELTKEAPAPELEAMKAEILLHAGRTAEGEQVLKALSKRDDVGSELRAAQAYLRLERYADALPILQRATAKQPAMAAASFHLAVSLERTGRRDAAVVELRRLLALDPDFHPALNHLAYLFAEAGEHLDEALNLARRAVSLAPENGAYVDTLGWAYYRLGQRDDAQKVLERAARLSPEDGDVQEHLGDLYVALGQRDRAQKAYHRAAELDPKKSHALDAKLGALDAKQH